jgi:SAM-dependent methyltransferase
MASFSLFRGRPKNFTQKLRMKDRQSPSYRRLCTEYYELDKPQPPSDALSCYSRYAREAEGPILEPMCGSGRFLIPLAKAGYNITGFDSSDHMLDRCVQKIKKENLQTNVALASFATFQPSMQFKLVFIPSGSFCLLIDPRSADEGLHAIVKWLEMSGKFVFEVDTMKSMDPNPGCWKSNSIAMQNGQRIVLNTLTQFNPHTHVEQTFCRYELWDQNTITHSEVEEFNVRLYETNEVDAILKKHNLTLVKKRTPYTDHEPDHSAKSVLFECVKNF